MKITWSLPFLFLVLPLFSSVMAWSSSMDKNETPENYFVELRAADAQERGEIANFIHLDQIIEDSVYAVVNRHDFQQLQKHLPHFLIQSHPISWPHSHDDAKGKKAEEIEFPSQDEKYHTYAEVLTEIQNLHRQYPDITSLFSLGKTVDQTEIMGIRITAAGNTKTKAFVPGIFFVGSHHAREHLSTEVPMGLINHLLKNSQSDPAIAKLIQTRDIYIVPMLNIDGAMYDIQGRRYKMWRKNRVNNRDGNFGVDLNRNYSYGWGTGGSSRSTGSDVYMGPTAFSEPETRALKTFVETHANIRILLSFHTFSELILYPWGGKYDGVGGRDEQVFTKMATTMAAWNGYKPEQASDLYIASGDTCDWAYGDHGIFCFTFELSPKSGMFGGGFYPGAGVIDKVTQANLRPALYLIDLADDPYRVLK